MGGSAVSLCYRYAVKPCHVSLINECSIIKRCRK